MEVVNSTVKGYILKTVKIVRIGEEANKFVANEFTFKDLLWELN